MLPFTLAALLVVAEHYAPICPACSLIAPRRTRPVEEGDTLEDVVVPLRDMIRELAGELAPGTRGARNPGWAFETLAAPHVYIHHMAVFEAVHEITARAWQERGTVSPEDERRISLIFEQPPDRPRITLAEMRRTWAIWDEHNALMRRDLDWSAE